jgi:hypothetical protein
MKKILLYLFFIPFVSISQNCNIYYLQLNDSLGDGWNGNYISIIDSSGNIVFSTTLDSGLTMIDSVCLIDDCYTISCDSGLSQNEVNWSFLSDNGVELFSGGAPFFDTICFPYDCTPSLESFETLPISWTNGIYNGFGTN